MLTIGIETSRPGALSSRIIAWKVRLFSGWLHGRLDGVAKYNRLGLVNNSTYSRRDRKIPPAAPRAVELFLARQRFVLRGLTLSITVAWLCVLVRCEPVLSSASVTSSKPRFRVGKKAGRELTKSKLFCFGF